jgi:hypothetical protein
MGNRLLSIGISITLGLGQAFAQAPVHLPVDQQTFQNQANQINEQRWNAQLSQLNAQYDAQIAAQKSAIDRANSLADQCNSDRQIQDIQNKQASHAATAQALAGMAGPTMQTAGSLIERQRINVGEATQQLQQEREATIKEAKSFKNKGTPRFIVSNNSVKANPVYCNEMYPIKENDDLQDMKRQNCMSSASSEARNYTDDLRDNATKITQLGQANNQLIANGAQMAAAGVAGVLAGPVAAGSQAKAQGKVADINKKMCLQQAGFAVADAERKLQQIEKDRAQKMLDFNVQKAADDLARQQAALMKPPVTTVASGPDKAKTPFQFSPQGGGDSGSPASNGGGGGSGAGGGAAPWAFGKGDGEGDEPGGSPLPESPGATTYAGEGGGGSAGEAGGFGNFAKNDPAAAGPQPASVDGSETDVGAGPSVGDGGLETLMIRMRRVHAKYAPVLLQSQDLSQVATGLKNSGEL